MPPTIRMVQKRLQAPPLIWRPDMTAFAAVMVVLVWLFVAPSGMIIRDFSRPSVDVPYTRSAVPLRYANREDAMVVSVARDGAVYFRNAHIRPNQLRPIIRDSLNRGSKPTVYFNIDARCKTAAFVEVWEEVRVAGIQRVAIVTNKRSGPSTWDRSWR